MIIILHSLISGVIVSLLSKVILNLSIKDQTYKPYGIEIAFFMTGVILSILFNLFCWLLMVCYYIYL